MICQSRVGLGLGLGFGLGLDLRSWLLTHSWRSDAINFRLAYCLILIVTRRQQRERERERQTDRQTDRQRERKHDTDREVTLARGEYDRMPSVRLWGGPRSAVRQ